MSLYKTKYQLDKTSIKNLTRESSGYAQIPLQEWSIHSSYYLECCQLTFSWISLWEFAPSQKDAFFHGHAPSPRALYNYLLVIIVVNNA